MESNPLKPSIVFFGSGPVATESLRGLLEIASVEAVITKPKAAHHRGDMPTLDFCQQSDIAYFTPTSKKELSELFRNNKFKSSLGIVIDYGIIIQQPVIDCFSLGIINSHFSLLPQWRGADPITFTILSGQQKTGVSLMKIAEKLDEGPLLTRQSMLVDDKETTPSLTKKLIRLSNSLLKEYLPLYSAGKVEPIPQEGPPSYSRKLTKEDGIVNWQKPAVQIEREVRAFIQWPKSVARIGKQQFILKEIDVVDTTGMPGQFTVSKKELVVYCGEKALSIKSLQPLGRKEMPIQAFLAGYKL